MKDLISIIVPVYKVEPYLNRCIQSIVEQTYRNIEIVLVDDGSPDRCPEMCDEWAEKDKRIVVIHKENGGLSDARNKGIDASKGTLVTFVDSDDYIDKRFIECLYTQMIETGAQISCVGLQTVSDDFNSEITPKIEKTKLYSREEAVAALFDLSSFQNYAWNKLYDKTLFDDIRFPIGRTMEDLAIMYRIIERCNLISYCPTKLYYYYQRPDSIIHDSSVRITLDNYYFGKERYLYIKDKYPQLVENYKFFNYTILQSYLFLEKNEAIYARKVLLKNQKFGLIDSTTKIRIKKLLILATGQLYCKIWRYYNKFKRGYWNE